MFTDEFIEAFAAALAEKMPRPDAIELSFESLGIEPMKLYTAAEVAHLLGCHKVTVYQIPETELPKQRRAGTGVGYYGINILMYQNGLAPVDMTKRLEEYRDALMRDRPAVKPLQPAEEEFTRVM